MQLAWGRALAEPDAADEPAPVTWRALAPSYAAGAAITLVVALVALGLGTARIPPQTAAGILVDHLPLVSIGEYSATHDAIIWQVRAPRVLLAGLVGATLAFSGAAYQAVFRNPLAEPYIIGVAAGASVGATLIIISPVFVASGVLSPVPPAAFSGALIAVGLAYGIARVGRAVTPATLILSGVAVSSIGTSIVTYLMLTYSERTLEILNWVLGGFNTATWTDAGIAAPYMVTAAAVVLPFARLLNVLQLDEDEARQLGVRTEQVKLVVLGFTSLATAAAVAVSGLIGFVGLVVPHSVRMVVGPDYRRVLPLSAFAGACFLIMADTAVRTFNGGKEVPIGVVTALIGAPFFLLLLRQYSRPRWETP
jgi:iron complex transport system permease protein